MTIEPEELRKCAAEFKIAKIEYDTASNRMDEAVKELKTKWEGVAQQTFYAEYEALHQYMDAFGKLVTVICTEMNNLADEYEKADK